MRVLLIQGANMEYLGYRQPELYGTTTASELDAILQQEAESLGVDLDIHYLNIEGEAISLIYQGVRDGVDALVMNPAGFLYAGYALRDCLKAIPVPYIEVHMTNIDARGMHSVTATECAGMITGLGVESYRLALSAAVHLIKKKEN
ncbi:type II 3-dehydroquinate dehydratase [Arthrobacter sp. NPDC080031]|uniref:type II 3-dehydroquinate dehydratase n=1 Tax=Arthrobacter sp. NPDC080031 TaxID=3155918 RepID=UPI00344B52AA